MRITPEKLATVSPATKICCWACAVVACAGCQNPKGLVIAPPEGFFNRPASYYSPAFGTNPAANLPASNSNVAPISLAPDAAKTDANNSLTPMRPGSPLPPVNAGEIPAKTAPLIPDTYDITARIPQDNQPIRIIERGTNIASNNFTPRGMTINDGTRATAWGQPASPSSSGFGNSNFGSGQPRSNVGISMAGLRGATNAPSQTLEANSFSNRDGQWKSRGSYEATEHR